jgi:hypothetical protein
MIGHPCDLARPIALHDPALRSLVSALDGCAVQGNGYRWTASVDGVHADDRGWWIQVSRADDATASVVVHCSRFATAEHLRTVLQHWRPCPSHTLQILEGMSRV